MFAVAVAVVVGLAVPQQPDPAALQQELVRLVDLQSDKARAIAAEALAKKNLATPEQWLVACANFGEFAALEAGPSRQDVDLLVLSKTERTEIHLLVPVGYDGKKPAPLLLWGHGAGGSGAREYLLWQEVANRIGMLVLAPTEFGSEAGWGFQPRERAAQLAALRWARRVANVDENAIFVGGVSRGGHMAWDLALRHPDLFAGVLPCIGGPRMQVGEQNNLRFLENVAHLPIRDLQGSKDDPLLLENLHLVFDRLKKHKAPDVLLHEFPEMGHSFDLAAIDWAEFFTRRRDPSPKTVVRTAVDLGEARASFAVITGIDRKISATVMPQVSAALWDRLDETKRRAYLLDRLVESNARLEVTHRGKGIFAASGVGVTAFELLLATAMLGRDGAVEVKWQSRPVRSKVVPSAAVLLAEFAERFDRTFLPVARVAVR